MCMIKMKGRKVIGNPTSKPDHFGPRYSASSVIMITILEEPKTLNMICSSDSLIGFSILMLGILFKILENIAIVESPKIRAVKRLKLMWLRLKATKQ